MKIKYRANGSVREVRDSIGKSLIANGIAVAVGAKTEQTYQTREMTAQTPAPAISPRTGKPRRKYKTRAMQAEE